MNMNMNIKSTLKKNVIDMERFIEDDAIIQGIVEFSYKDKAISNEQYFLSKLIAENDSILIVGSSLYFQYIEKNDLDLNEVSRTNILFVINKKLNIILTCRELDIFPIKYKVLNMQEEFIKMNNYYIDNYIELLDQNFSKIINVPKYKELYSKVTNSPNSIIRNYIEDSDTSKTAIDLPNFSNKHNLVFLEKYIEDNSIIKEMVQNNFHSVLDLEDSYNWVVISYIEYAAKRDCLEKLRKSPTKEILFRKSIYDAIKVAGKTLNIITKEGKLIKVDNVLFENFTEFRPVKSSEEWIKIYDIKQILFGKKVLFDADTIN